LINQSYVCNILEVGFYFP